jgi:hypothetical protein
MAKLVICDVRNGSIISQNLPKISGIEWIEIPGTRYDIGSYFQADFAGIVPDYQCLTLPEYCYIDDRFNHVTRINIQGQSGEILEICYQDIEGYPIQVTTY